MLYDHLVAVQSSKGLGEKKATNEKNEIPKKVHFFFLQTYYNPHLWFFFAPSAEKLMRISEIFSREFTYTPTLC